MPRDAFGNLIKTDIFGKKIPKKQIKKEVIDENRRKGKAGEDTYRLSAALRGVEVERTGRGHDFIERERDILTGKVKKSTYVEVKSSSKAPLSEIQKKNKKKKSNYKVERVEPLFY
ncbi:MAG TPA: hypothetical protein HA257_03595 [Candidatus Methanoperedenaceae archaeon]|nr:hypothetical protein [Candidatus Methanoperedenaceae archaeon]